MDTRQTDISNSRSNETLQIEGRQGIQMIIPTFKFYIKDWSIEEVIWISDNEIAFETYEERRSTENENKLKYNYYKTKVME